MSRLAAIIIGLTLLAIADPARAADVEPSPGCFQPLSALEIGALLNRQGVGGKFYAAPHELEPPEGHAASDRGIVIITFGCLGNYLDELRGEDRDPWQAKRRLVRFVDQDALVIVLSRKRLLPREAAVIRLTLAALVPQ